MIFLALFSFERARRRKDDENLAFSGTRASRLIK